MPADSREPMVVRTVVRLQHPDRDTACSTAGTDVRLRMPVPDVQTVQYQIVPGQVIFYNQFTDAQSLPTLAGENLVVRNQRNLRIACSAALPARRQHRRTICPGFLEHPVIHRYLNQMASTCLWRQPACRQDFSAVISGNSWQYFAPCLLQQPL